MTETHYSKGKWGIKYLSRDQLTRRVYAVVTCDKKQEKEIANIIGPVREDGVINKESAANAMLISNAKALLEIVGRGLAQHGHVGDDVLMDIAQGNVASDQYTPEKAQLVLEARLVYNKAIGRKADG